MARSGNPLLAAVLVWLIGLVVAGMPVFGREVKLTIYPQKVSAEAGKYSLLPPPASLTDGDAVPWYEKAVKALPGKASDDRIRQWLNMPIDQLPADQVEEALTQYLESFKRVAKAVKCRECNWPAWTPGTQVANVDEYRRLAFGIRLWTRFELSNGQYEGAMLALQTGLGMARQLGQAPTLMQLQLGVGAAASMCREIEQLVQMEGSPNLCVALAGLPKPLVDAEKAIESERRAASSGSWTNRLLRTQFESQMKPMHDRTRVLVKRLDSDLVLLQCVEAIRSYAASHGGQLPQTLDEIREVSIPQDAMCGAAFRYTRTGAATVLASTAPSGGEKTDEVHYEIVVKN